MKKIDFSQITVASFIDSMNTVPTSQLANFAALITAEITKRAISAEKANDSIAQKSQLNLTDEVIRKAISEVMDAKYETNVRRKSPYKFSKKTHWYSIYKVLHHWGVIKENDFAEMGRYVNRLFPGSVRISYAANSLAQINNGAYSKDLKKWKSEPNHLGIIDYWEIAEIFMQKLGAQL